MAQQAKPLVEIPVSQVAVLRFGTRHQSPFLLLVNVYSEGHQVMGHALVFLPPVWETWIEPDPVLAVVGVLLSEAADGRSWSFFQVKHIKNIIVALWKSTTLYS